MDVEYGLVDCDWRVDITSCTTEHQKNVVRVVLILCVCCYLILAAVGYGILWARNRYNLTPPGPIIDFHHPDGGIRPKPIESFCALSIGGLLVRSLALFLVIIDAFPHANVVQELISEIAVCCGFPCWACFVIGVWYATPKLSVPGDNLKIRVPRPKVINSVFFYLFFGPLLLDLPSVISSGTFLARKEYVKANIAIAVHYITLGGLLTFATGIFYFTLNQLAKAIEEYTVPDELTLVHVGVVPVADIVGGQTFTLSPLTDSEKEDSDMWDTSLAKVRQRLIGIRKAGTAMLCFYVVVYLIYGITRPLIHSHSVLNVVFCLIFNLDPGTPTIFAYFILSILIHVNAGPPRLQEVYQVPRPPLVYMPTSRPNRPINDSFIFELHRTGSYSAITEYTMRTSSKESNIRSVGISHLNRLDAIDEKESESENQGSSQSPDKTVVVKEKPVVLSTSFRDPMRGSVSSIGSAPTFTSMP